jgi:hypothetical protein
MMPARHQPDRHNPNISPHFLNIFPLLEAATLTTLAGCRPAQPEGPYFVDARLNRADIRSDPSDGAVQEGIPLSLVFLPISCAG